MTYQVVTNEGKALDAHLDIQAGDIRFYSRSGTTGTPSARNVDYSAGLQEVLRQLRDAGISIVEAFVDSGSVQAIALDERRILSVADAGATPDEQWQRLSQRMRAVGRSSDKPGGNNNKLIRLRTTSTSETLRASLRLKRAEVNLRSTNRIPDGQFQAVKPHHVWQAIQELRDQTDWQPFSPSKDYDVLLEDGTRLPPKAVFGRAASLALGYTVLPIHFSGGVGTPCFKVIEAAGFAVVTKTGLPPAHHVPPSEEETWTEGAPKLTTHMRRERARGLAQAKKSAFMAANDGRLFCEECLFEPIKVHADPVAAACIEVHHRETSISQMNLGHQTTLADLQCLCANCHRLTHARLREAEKTLP